MTDNIFNKAKEAAKGAVSNVTDKVISFKDNYLGDEQEEIAEDFKDAGSGKIKETVDSINGSIGLITSAGYEFKGMGVSLGLSPSISLSFHYLNSISDEERLSVMEQAEGNKMVKLILKLLFKAGDFYTSIKMGDYGLDAVNISLGLSPGLNITFKKI
ncbi:MAG: hypothetical protein PHN88_02130 [Ignavibacteria bacterium]|nr:hypothetical protein [Ignavibacteria bacterium]